MLPLPDLDDRTFKQIVEESRKMIPQLIPEWTDENYHDPGITFIDLFAWLTEMQEYYLNRITIHSQKKFLKLLGLSVRGATMARTDVTFTGVSRPVQLPGGSKLLAGDEVFESEEPFLLLDTQIEKIIVFSDTESRDYSSFNQDNGLSYYTLGREARNNNRLYIGLNKELPLDEIIALSIQLYEDYPIKMKKVEENGARFVPSAKVVWTYYGDGLLDEPPAWLPLEIISDASRSLSCSGYLRFKIPTSMKAASMHLAHDRERYWLACSLEEEGYEIPPRVREISLNCVPVIHRDTISQIISFSSNGEVGQSFVLSAYLPLYGCNFLQVQDEEGNWLYYTEVDNWSEAGPEDRTYVLSKNIEEQKVIIGLGDGKCGIIPPKGEDNIRLISCLPSFEEKRFIGRSNGLPGQRFRLPDGPYMAENFFIQVAKNTADEEDLWQDWQEVMDFDASGPADRHYMLDLEAGEIIFGNNENGIIPEISEKENIVIISCQKGGGERGNVKQYEINRMSGSMNELEELQVANHFPASGGMESESLEEAKKRLRRELKEQDRAVTSEDYERIARSTPGVRVARVKAIPLYTRGLKEYPRNQAPAQLTVVVVPYSEDQKPVPSKGFLETVRQHLNQYRLLTTEIQVIPPEYIKIMVYAVVVISPGKELSSQKIVNELERYLQPLDSTDGSQGWPFGRTVYKGDIYGVINRIDGVEYIKDLWLNVEGAEFKKEISGDIKIPPYGLAYLGEHEIEVINRQDL